MLLDKHFVLSSIHGFYAHSQRPDVLHISTSLMDAVVFTCQDIQNIPALIQSGEFEIVPCHYNNSGVLVLDKPVKQIYISLEDLEMNLIF